MYAVTSTPLDSRTRATLRSAEFGFFGVVVYTRVQTPRRWGEPFRAGVLFFDTLSWRPLRTSWLMVGTAWFSLCRPSESVLLMGHPRGRACRPPRAAAGTPLRLAFDRVLRTQPRAALPRTHDGLAVPGTIAKTTGCPEEGQNAGRPLAGSIRHVQSTDRPKRETAGQAGILGAVVILSHRVTEVSTASEVRAARPAAGPGAPTRAPRGPRAGGCTRNRPRAPPRRAARARRGRGRARRPRRTPRSGP